MVLTAPHISFARAVRRSIEWTRQTPAAKLMPTTTDADSQDRIDQDGAIAQLGERLNGIQEVGGSTPPGSTTFPHRLQLARNFLTRRCRLALFQSFCERPDFSLRVPDTSIRHRS